MANDSTLVQHRTPADGADPLALAGVNDAHLLELGRLAGLRVVLRDDHLLLSGDLAAVERAVPVAREMVRMAQSGTPFGVDEVARFFEASATESGVARLAEAAGRVVVPGPKRTVAPKSEGQARYLEALASHDVVVGIGPAGTGKTYLAVAMAVDALFRKRVKRIILARPAVEAGENLGFLPGDLQEKIDPYLRPLYDALEDMIPADRLRRALESRAIEIAPLAYMRGRTLQEAFVILDEAQNATRAQMKMFLTRLGLNSRAVITGDKTQIDLPRREESGLVEIEAVLQGIDGIGFVYLEGSDVVRHRLVRDIIRAYDAASGEDSAGAAERG
jgi:phosphate starvation-inducible protein PhoH and related proteins